MDSDMLALMGFVSLGSMWFLASKEKQRNGWMRDTRAPKQQTISIRSSTRRLTRLHARQRSVLSVLVILLLRLFREEPT
jgi:hypothetical protein